MLYELDHSSEILLARSDAFIETMQGMVDHGLDIDLIHTLYRDHQSEFHDFAGVALGIKPYASFLHHIVDCFWRGDYQETHYSPGAYLWGFTSSRTSHTEVPIMIDIDNFHAWNPQYILRIMQANRDLVQAIEYHQDPVTTVYDERDFAHFIRFLNNEATEASITLEALLHGYPRIAGLLFGRYFQQMIEASESIWDIGTYMDIQLHNQEPPTAPIQLERNRDGYRDDFLLLASHINVDPGLLTYVRHMRPADVPGYPYTTCGGLTQHAEERTRQIWAMTGFDRKMETFLNISD